jgi:hypothetical protein
MVDAMRITMRVSITTAVLDSVDLERFRPYVAEEYATYFWQRPGEEHYRLLAYLSSCFDGATLIDLGTDKGCSALALSSNVRNRVISYDIVDRKRQPIDLPNIEFRIGDALADVDLLLRSPLILLDTAHDGPFERAVYRLLDTNSYRGLLLVDDIYLNDPMKEFWAGIERPKHDLSNCGHWSGTGLVVF